MSTSDPSFSTTPIYNSEIKKREPAWWQKLMSLVFMSNAVLYWLNSGIYVTQNGDHVVKQGGWFAREDKLLNGVIVANQVKRNPIDQIFGMASIQTGLFGDKRLVGVRYDDIKDYDNRVRNRMDEPFRTMF